MAIDYGMGTTNIDHKKGIRYGVISQHSISPDSLHDFESDYGQPTCPHCGGDLTDEIPEDVEGWESFGHFPEYACLDCKLLVASDYAFSEEPLSLTYEDEQYKIVSCLDSALMVIKSPYYTMATFCSPCVPGAGNLDSPGEDCKAYCLGHDWFEGGKAPYDVYDVATGELVRAEEEK